jgi:hypothetical protein
MPARPLIQLDIIEDYVSFPKTKSEEPTDQEVVLRHSQLIAFSPSLKAQEAFRRLKPAV